jgi:hypothetical protein
MGGATAYRILVENLKVGKQRRKREDITLDLKETMCEGFDGFTWLSGLS